MTKRLRATTRVPVGDSTTRHGDARNEKQRKCRGRSSRRTRGALLAAVALAPALTMAVPAHSVPVDQPSYPFPIRQIDLPAAHYVQVNWDHDGGKARDFGVVRWTGSNWVTYEGATFDASDNEDYLIFGTPVFSPVDGTVVSCWRNHPENTGNKVHPGREDDPPTIIRAGNHLNILTADNKVVNLSHLKQQSIPPELCPIDTSTDPDGSFITDATDKDGGEFPVEAVIPKAQRPTVVQGQFLGRVGNTGASGGPHLHLHLQPVPNPDAEPIEAGDLIDLKYHGIYTRPRLNGDLVHEWDDLKGAPMPAVNGTQVWASPFLNPQSNVKAGALTEATTVAVGGFGAVTASRNALGNLEMSTHALGILGEPSLRDQDGAAAASEIAMARPGTGRDVVTAIRDGGGNLRLIGWDISFDGQIDRRGMASAGAVSRVAVTGAPTTQPGVITAVRGADGRLKLISWKVDNANGAIERVADATGVAVSELAVTSVVNGRSLSTSTARPFTGVVTASRDGSGNLRLDAWRVTPDLQILPAGNHVAEAVSKVSAATARSDSAHDAVVTMVRDGEGKFRVTHWTVDVAGGIARHDTTRGGEVHDVKLVAAGQDVIGTMQVGTTVRLMTFRAYADGRIGRDGENLPYSGILDVLPGLSGIDTISAMSAPVFAFGRTYILGLFGGGGSLLAPDLVVSWRYSM